MPVIIASVPAGVVSRSVEEQAVARFLAAASDRVTGLVIEGEAGIGKTTLWVSAVEQAREGGFAVLTARTGPAESVLAYSAIADLLGNVDDTLLARLPDVQRLAVDRVLLRDSGGGAPTDQRVVATALISVLDVLAEAGPVLVAFDDIQWLDASSRTVIAYAARRLRSAAGLLCTERCQPGQGQTLSWLQLANPDGLDRIPVRPLHLGGVHALINHRLGRSLPRPVLVRITEISGGNPLYALELARAAAVQSPGADSVLPASLAELMRARIGHLTAPTRAVLLAAACAANPTVDLLARATDTASDEIVSALEDPENAGIVTIDGNRVTFTHPLLGHSVYTDAGPVERRTMHRRLAEAEHHPELKARHLALAGVSEDPATLAALDAAADAARARGAPAAAAELLELAIRLGGDELARRVRAAENHMIAGNTPQAENHLDAADLQHLEHDPLWVSALIIRASIRIYENSFAEAAQILSSALTAADDNPILSAPILLFLATAQVNAGDYDAALRNADRAVTIAEAIGIPTLISQTLAVSVMVGYLCGRGFDRTGMQRALDLEDLDGVTAIPLSASANNALVLAWSGHAPEAHVHMQRLHNRCLERGADTEVMFTSLHGTMIELWRGDLPAAAVSAGEAVERAEQLGGDPMLVYALTMRAAVAAYAGREDDARNDIRAALVAAGRCSSPREGERTIETRAFLEISVGNYADALAATEPLIAKFDELPSMEFPNTAFVPYAVEALVALGRPLEAEPMVAAMEAAGRRVGRPWMLAIGARCRAMILAAQGDVDAATAAAQRAMTEHERLPMPFELARTQLLLGQLQRRQRRKEAAAIALRAALDTFEQLGVPIWAQRARTELARSSVGRGGDSQLTPSELRVAQLAADGMKNRDIAAAMFISVKTVEHNLSCVYRKLGIRSRAELGRRIDDAGG